MTRYLVNVFGEPLYVADLNKICDYEEGKRKIEVVEEDEWERSSDLRKLVRNGQLWDVTDQVLNHIKARTEGAVQERTATTRPVRPAPTEEFVQQDEQQDLRPRVIPKPAAPIMVDEREASRALAGSDANAHKAHLNTTTRQGADTGLLVELYDAQTNEKVEKQRTSYLVDEEDRSTGNLDPRFAINKRRQDREALEARGGLDLGFLDLPPVPTRNATANALPELPLAQFYTNHGTNRPGFAEDGLLPHQHAPQNQDPNWWTRSVFATQRMQEKMARSAQRQQTQRESMVDPRIAYNNAGPAFQTNPIFDQLAALDAPTPEYDENGSPTEAFNPLVDNLLADLDEPHVTAKATKSGRKSTKATTATTATKATKSTKGKGAATTTPAKSSSKKKK